MTAKNEQQHKPADGVAALLHLVEAIRDMRGNLSDEGFALTAEAEHWVRELDAWIEREQPEPEPMTWHPRRWREVLAGDRVSVGGVEAEVVLAGPLQSWHVDPRSSEYRPAPLEHEVYPVTLRWDGQEKRYSMPPDGEVECLRGDAGVAVDEANAFRSSLAEEPINVLESWAEDAVSTLRAAGLRPERMS